MIPALILAALNAAADPAPTVTPEPDGPQCFASMSEMVEYLSAWSERPAWTGSTLDDGAVVVFAGKSSWSLVAAFGGLVCVIEQGGAWTTPAGDGL